ncbi:MAG TPA: B12-binding domain-containing radical SAM protein [Clostridiales bacterium]|nr:B12-binding domain-containing radical SAM protein [Clostridiales bacterium]
MRYEGAIYRPPSEAQSLILQATIGCSHNNCTFCNSFRDKKFRIRSTSELEEDLTIARRYYKYVRRVYLADGNAFCIPSEWLLEILRIIKKLFPECERVSTHACVQDVLAKTSEELIALREMGMGIIYMGGESGNQEILDMVKKGITRAELIAAARKLRAAGMLSSVTFISGLGGRRLWREHAIDTGTVISEMEPDYASLLTLILEPGMPLFDDLHGGRFELLSPQEVLQETKLLIENINLEKDCVFRSNHASNYLALKGTLPRDKDSILNQLSSAKWLKPEEFRML